MLRNKGYSLINITGLAAGIAICLVIFVVIQYERSFDTFHQKKDRIYRVMLHGEKDDYTGAVPFPVPTALRNDFPELEQTAGVYNENDAQILVLDKEGHPVKKFKEKTGMFMVEPSFFNIFDFPWLAGSAATSMQDPHSAILTQKTAEKYFGNWKNAVGQSIRINNRSIFKVTGVLANVPSNTDFQLSLVLPYSLGTFSKSTDWVSVTSAHACYVLLPPNVTATSFNQQLAAFSKRHRATDNKNFEMLQPITEVHYDAKAGNFLGKTISHERIRSLWLIAAFILIIACVNFINLSTAQAVNRAKEVGVRKVLGSSKKQLTVQFLLETMLLVIAGVAIAILMAVLLLHPVGEILDTALSYRLLLQPAVAWFLLIITVSVTLLAGFYPSLVLSGFNPVAALKSRAAARSTKGISLRRALVVFQFIIAQALIIGTLLLIRQMKYFQDTPLGFNKEAVVNVPFQADSAGRSRLGLLKSRLLEVKGIQMVSYNSTPPADADNWWTGFRFNHAAKETDFAAITKWGDVNYLPVYGLQLVAGRNITPTDSIREFLVNETLVKKLGIANPGDVLNKEIDVWNGQLKGPVVGVIKDFHNSSLKDAIAPIFITNPPRRFNTAGIKIASSDITAVIKAIEKIWSDVYPDYVFEYQFFDDKIAGFYREETQLSHLYTLFAGIAIFLSCLGLYGLASFMAVQRIKEVGIRKVLGASVANIVYLFSREFVLLIAVAFVIATPLAWYFMHQWLQNYTYRVNIGWWLFLAGGMGSVAIALVTVSFQAIKAALTNPVKNLRTE